VKERILEIGDVVQISPESENINKAFAACMMVVTEPKEWGAQGYVTGLGTREEQGGLYYYRVKWEDMEFVGKAAWVRESHDTPE